MRAGFGAITRLNTLGDWCYGMDGADRTFIQVRSVEVGGCNAPAATVRVTDVGCWREELYAAALVCVLRYAVCFARSGVTRPHIFHPWTRVLMHGDIL